MPEFKKHFSTSKRSRGLYTLKGFYPQKEGVRKSEAEIHMFKVPTLLRLLQDFGSMTESFDRTAAPPTSHYTE